jgi:hypothetical protein
VDFLIAAGEIVAGLALVVALAAIVGIAVMVTLEDAARLYSWARGRRHRRHAHPVTRSARERARTRAAVCRCVDSLPCREHPFAFDYERLLVPRGGKSW